jgi:hypothetical protein
LRVGAEPSRAERVQRLLGCGGRGRCGLSIPLQKQKLFLGWGQGEPKEVWIVPSAVSLEEEPWAREEVSGSGTELFHQVPQSGVKRFAHAEDANRRCLDSNVAFTEDDFNAEAEGLKPSPKIVWSDQEHAFATSTTTLNDLRLVLMDNSIHN